MPNNMAYISHLAKTAFSVLVTLFFGGKLSREILVSFYRLLALCSFVKNRFFIAVLIKLPK